MRELRVHLVVHYDPVVTDDTELNTMKSLVAAELAQIDPALRMHDFRMVRGPQHTNLIFDLVLPHSSRGREAEYKKRIDERVQFEDRKYYTVITFESAYTSER